MNQEKKDENGQVAIEGESLFFDSFFQINFIRN